MRFLFVILFFPLLSYAANNPVIWETVQSQPYQNQVKVSGKLSNKSEQKMSFKVSGIVSTIAVDEGQVVHKGQLLASLDKEEINAQHLRASAIFEQAKLNFKRLKKLFSANLISQEQLNLAQTDMDIARADLAIVSFNQKHTDIVAPADGVVLDRRIELNELISANQPAFTISNSQNGWVFRSAITDKHIVKLKNGAPASLFFDAYPNHEFKAIVSEVAAAANNDTGLFEIELALTNTKESLFSGLIGSANINIGEVEPAIFIPFSALTQVHEKQAFVYIVDEKSQARKQRITLGEVNQNQIRVAAGLSDGDRLVIQGAQQIKDDNHVVHTGAGL